MRTFADMFKDLNNKHIQELNFIREDSNEKLKIAEDNKELALQRLYHVQETLRAHMTSRSKNRDGDLIEKLYGQFRSDLN